MNTENLDTGLYMGTIHDPYGKKVFPYNIIKLRDYLKKTGKTLEQLSYEEIQPFRVATAN